MFSELTQSTNRQLEFTSHVRESRAKKAQCKRTPRQCGLVVSRWIDMLHNLGLVPITVLLQKISLTVSLGKHQKCLTVVTHN